MEGVSILHYKCLTHPLLHDFHLLLEYWQDTIFGQAFVQLDHILAVFQDLCAELIQVQLHQCALWEWIRQATVKLRRDEMVVSCQSAQSLSLIIFFPATAESDLTWLQPFCRDSHSSRESQSSRFSLNSELNSSRLSNLVTSTFTQQKIESGPGEIVATFFHIKGET